MKRHNVAKALRRLADRLDGGLGIRIHMTPMSPEQIEQFRSKLRAVDYDRLATRLTGARR